MTRNFPAKTTVQRLIVSPKTHGNDRKTETGGKMPVSAGIYSKKKALLCVFTGMDVGKERAPCVSGTVSGAISCTPVQIVSRETVRTEKLGGIAK